MNSEATLRNDLQLRPVAVEKLTYTGAMIQLNAGQTIIAQDLMVANKIVEQHRDIWFKKRSQRTVQALSMASRTINSLVMALHHLDDPVRFSFHLMAALRGKSFEQLIKCIRCFKGACASEISLVAEHRNQLKNHLNSFLWAMQDYHTVYALTEEQQRNLLDGGWQNFIDKTLKEIDEVDCAADMEGDASVDAVPNGIYA